MRGSPLPQASDRRQAALYRGREGRRFHTSRRAPACPRSGTGTYAGRPVNRNTSCMHAPAGGWWPAGVIRPTNAGFHFTPPIHAPMCMRDARAGAAASVCLIRGCREREDTLLFSGTPRLRCLACFFFFGWGGGRLPAVATRARRR